MIKGLAFIEKVGGIIYAIKRVTRTTTRICFSWPQKIELKNFLIIIYIFDGAYDV